MSAAGPGVLGLIVRAAPYAGRSPRDALDVALAAATLEHPLEIYFLGPAIWQLVEARNPDASGLPRGLKGWSAISGLTRAHFFAISGDCERVKESGAKTVVELEALDRDAMQKRWRGCDKVLVL